MPRPARDPHSSERAAHMRAIIAEPLDDLPRLAYCDALVEWGEDAESERIQTAMVSGDRTENRGGNAYVYRRGFLAEARCRMDWWMQMAGFFLGDPLEVVTISDKEPFYSNQDKSWEWTGTDPPDRIKFSYRLPNFIFQRLTAAGLFRKRYRTRDLAIADLSQACIAHMRAKGSAQ